jgi:Putative peptidoglycan binding domain
MLLTAISAKKVLVAGLTALSIAAVPAAPALAWGDKEQGFVAGVATAVIIDEILKNNRKARLYDRGHTAAPIYVEPRPVYVEPRHTTSIYSTPAARAFQSYSLSERKAIQRNLRAWGYYRGGIDGSFGPGTYNAVVAYARDEGATANLKSTSGAYGIYDGMIY